MMSYFDIYHAFCLISYINNVTRVFSVIFQVRYYCSKNIMYFVENLHKPSLERVKKKKKNPRAKSR